MCYIGPIFSPEQLALTGVESGSEHIANAAIIGRLHACLVLA